MGRSIISGIKQHTFCQIYSIAYFLITFNLKIGLDLENYCKASTESSYPTCV